MFAVSLVMVITQMYGENQLNKQTKTKIFYCNFESKNLCNYLRHHRTNSRQTSSGHAARSEATLGPV